MCIILLGCQSSGKKAQKKLADNEIEIQSNVDTCLWKEGRSYSYIENNCVKLDRLPVMLHPLKEGMKVEGSPAYLLFDESGTSAEVFLPDHNRGLILSKIAEGNWKKDTYVLLAWKGWVLQESGKPVFGGDGME